MSQNVEVEALVPSEELGYPERITDQEKLNWYKLRMFKDFTRDIFPDVFKVVQERVFLDFVVFYDSYVRAYEILYDFGDFDWDREILGYLTAILSDPFIRAAVEIRTYDCLAALSKKRDLNE
jgi:hypothetical protein